MLAPKNDAVHLTEEKKGTEKKYSRCEWDAIRERPVKKEEENES